MDMEPELTEAEVLDTLQFVVAAEQRAAADDDDDDDAEPKPAPAPYQNRQKQELEYLKAKVRELELELRRLERENDDKLAQTGDDSTWQRIAQQQFVERQKSLSENARLKQELEGQLKFAKSLERVIRKRPNLSAFGDDDGPRRARRRKKRASPASLFDELSDTADREYERTDQALEASGLAKVFRDRRGIDVHVLDDEPNLGAANNQISSDLRIDWTIARRYPFRFQSVARELWKLLTEDSVTSHVADMDRTVEKTDDTLFARTSLRVRLGHRECTLMADAIIRRYVEEDSITIVWVSDGECETAKSAKDTFKLYEVGWIKMQPVEGDPSSCISHTLGYYYPTFSARVRGSPTSSSSENDVGSPVEAPSSSQEADDIGLLTELLTVVYEKSATQIHIAIENTLMAEAIARSENGSQQEEQ